MNAALIGLVLAVIAPVHVTGALAGFPVSFPAGWIILTAEVLVAGALSCLAIRVLRGFRSSPFPRPVPRGGAW